MWSLSQPDERRRRAALDAQVPLGFSYPEPGMTRLARPPAGYDVDHNRIQVGTGEPAFRAACDVLRRWEQFPAPWTRIWPADTPLEPGRTLTLAAHAVGLWWLNVCRIVYVVDEAGPPRRFGFAYGTLPGHVEAGEERFLVEWLPDDSVWYDVYALSRPRLWAVRLGYPLARVMQRRFARDSKAAVSRLVAEAVRSA